MTDKSRQGDLFASTRFEDTALPLFEEYRGDWLALARATAHALGLRQHVVTIDDVRALCPPPEGLDPRVMGAVFLAKTWHKIGYVGSRRGTCHHRPVVKFTLRGRD